MASAADSIGAVGNWGEGTGFIACPTPSDPQPSRLTREFYIHRVAVAIIISGGVDPNHTTIKCNGNERPCCCRTCRAWVCVRNTPVDELKEARCVAEELKTREWIDDLMFL